MKEEKTRLIKNHLNIKTMVMDLSGWMESLLFKPMTQMLLQRKTMSFINYQFCSHFPKT